MTIYQEVLVTGGYISNHESDLYIEVNDINREILSRYPTSKKITTVFRNEVTGKPCYDIPFSYDPWWEARQKKGII